MRGGKSVLLITVALGTVGLLLAWRRRRDVIAGEPEALSTNIQDRLEELERRISDSLPDPIRA
ncbi:MAG: hypothetical protein IT363_11545 [Methanoregulaceae archaeon]|nr:hypothetical protein [Methanoregulaceae archaeon]